MKARWFVSILFATSLLVPLAAADAPTLKVTVESDVPSIRISPGGRGVVNLTVSVEYVGYTCTAGTKIGVDLVPPVAPPDWFGANAHPGGDTYAYPKETNEATLTVVVDEDAPGNADGLYRLQPVVKEHAPQECSGVDPDVDAEEFSIHVLTPPPKTSAKVDESSSDPDGGNGIPGPSALSLILLGLSVWLFRQRRK